MPRLKFAALLAGALSLASMELAAAQTLAQSNLPAPEEIAAWADATYGSGVDAGRINGAVVAVVQDGEPIFARGYGYADGARTRLVSPEGTTFRLGSISKTFTALLVAQLQAVGRLPGLDSPLAEALPEGLLQGPYADQLTFRQALTHQSGLEEQLFAFATTDPDEDTGPRPRFYRPPGERTNYSNTAFGLLARAVETASGEPFGFRLQSRVFDALGMRAARYRTSVIPTPDLAESVAIAPDGARFPAESGWMLRLDRAASGGVEASGAAMQTYMIALLDRGRTDRRLGLDEAGFAPMFAEQRRTHPDTNGFGMAFFIADWNGERVVEHGGILPGNRAYLHLIPARGLGIFVATTGEGAIPPASALVSQWAHAPPPGAPPVRPMTLSEMRAENLSFFLGAPTAPARQPVAGSAANMAGRYAPERRNRSSVEHALDLVRADSMIRNVTALSATQIQLDGKWIFDEIAPGVFWRQAGDTSDGLGFLDTVIRLPADGDRADSFTFNYNDVDYERIGPADDIVLHRNILLLALLAGLTGAMFWLGGGAVRGAALAPLMVSAGVAGIFATLMVGFATNITIITEWSLGDTSRAMLLALVGTATAAAAAATFVIGGIAIAKGPGARGLLRLWRYVHHVLLMMIALGLVWALFQLRLIGWSGP